MSVIVVKNEIVHYEVLGHGRPLVFLHGWVGSWRYWIPTMQAASISFRTYALDLWGFGDSARNPAYYTIEQQVDLVYAFMQEMGIGKIALIGHGLGAVTALSYACNYPCFVDRVLVVGYPDAVEAVSPRMYNNDPNWLVDWLLKQDPINDLARNEALKTDPQAIQLSLDELGHFDLTMLPLNLTTPCLLVYGQNDPAVAIPLQEQFNIMPENIHQVVFEQSGHFPMLDEASKFNRLMADFLALSSGESPRQLQLKEEWKRRVR
jgi:pimeloyl-ACP methyl ester carboxylesterase